MATRIEPKDQAHELSQLPGWHIQNEVLKRQFQFETYVEGLAFATKIGHEAEAMDHHPDMTIGYKTVLVATSTHSAGGLTNLDFELAKKVSKLAGQ